MKKRPRVIRDRTFQQRLAEEAQRFKEAADQLPPGTAKELLLRRVRQAETAVHVVDGNKRNLKRQEITGVFAD